MIGLDTNVLVRFIVDSPDAPDPSVRARAVVQAAVEAEEEVFISTVTLVETVWVLRGAGRFNREAIARVIRTLLRARLFVVEGREFVEDALVTYEQGPGDFADFLIGAQSSRRGCRWVYTFDGDLHRRSEFREP